MYKINSKKMAYLGSADGYGCKFFTLKSDEGTIEKIKLLKQSDFNFEHISENNDCDIDIEDYYNNIMNEIDFESNYPLFVTSDGIVGICIIDAADSCNACSTFYELKDYTSLSSDEEIESIVELALKDRINALKTELSILNADD